MSTTVVVGGGIAGLTAAWALAGAGREVVVLEAAAEVGGKLQVRPIAGIPVDVGAEATLVRRPEALDLMAELGLGDAVITPLTTAARLRVGGALHPLPARTLLGVPTDVDALRASGAVTPESLRRVEDEPGLPPLPPMVHDVTVGGLLRARLGNEIVDRLVEPLLGGVYAGRADALSLRASIPALAARLRDGGSVVEAARAAIAAGATMPADSPVFASLVGGLGRLPRELAASGAFTVRTGITVRSVTRTAQGFALVCGAVPDAETVQAGELVLAVPPAKAARLLRAVAPTAAAELAAVGSASMAVVTLAFDDVDVPPGSGVLVGAREGLATKGVTLTSQKWPITTGGRVVLRGSIGRAGEEHVLQRTDADLVTLFRHDLATVLGVRADPVDSLVTRWGGGLPQYALGHVERVARIRAAVAAVPGLAVCGAAYDGVGIPACIASARAAAARLLDGPRAPITRREGQ